MSEDMLVTAARTAITDCLAVKKHETVLIVTDIPRKNIGGVFYEVASELGFETAMTVMDPGDTHGGEPPEAVARAMAAADVVVAPTLSSLTHTAARRAACEAGARVATMPGILPETLIRCLNADYEEIARRTLVVTALLDKARVVRLRSPHGTDITLPIEGCRAIASTGLIREPGSFGNLPSGEGYLMLREGESEGVIVFDGSVASIGTLSAGDRITLTVEAGFVTAIDGGEAAEKLRELLEPFGKPGRNIAELGVGTNHAAKICGAILEDEKVLGTVHIALGNNMSMGGTCDVGVHIDGLILSPDLELDGKPLLSDGKLILE